MKAIPAALTSFPPFAPEQRIEFYRGMRRDRFEELRAEGAIPFCYTWDMIQVALGNAIHFDPDLIPDQAEVIRLPLCYCEPHHGAIHPGEMVGRCPRCSGARPIS